MTTHKKNEEYEIVITDIGTEGEGIGHLDDGYTLFVQGGLPGDKVLAHIIKAQKKYAIAKLVKVISASSDRGEAPCPQAGRCGGCQIMELKYEAQLKYKANKVCELLTRVGGFEPEYISGIYEGIIGCDTGEKENETPVRFRNKAQYPVGRDREGNVITGFYAPHSHRIVACEDCLIGAPGDAKILKAIREFMDKHDISAYDENTHKGLIRHILIRTGYKTGEIQVCLIINGKSIPHAEELTDKLNGLSFDGEAKIVSICTSKNTEETNVIMGDEYSVLYGTGYITDMIGDLSFHISPLSFYQVNPYQTDKLYKKALEYAALTGSETVWDLYCGIGTISLFLARAAGKVYGVEVVPQAIEDARENARINRIDNAEFFTGKAEEVLPAFYADATSSPEALHPDVIVVDPPRKGCDSACLETMLKMQPERIVYVSCDPATLARDLKFLCEGGSYELKKVVNVDMFGGSLHVETVVSLVRK